VTIRKGEEWGRIDTVPDAAVPAADDASVAAAWSLGVVPLATGGNLHSSLGSPSPKQVGDACMRFPVDALEVTVTASGTAETVVAASDVVVGRWMRGDFAVVSANGRWAGLDIAPRAHPNDGFLHVLSIPRGVRVRQRLTARKRAVLGTHVPHPDITVTRGESFTASNTSRSRLLVDGRRWDRWESVAVRVLPDHAEVLA
jgi:hypothetical protein